eukprot:5563323-Amphidinium_carterae.1
MVEEAFCTSAANKGHAEGLGPTRLSLNSDLLPQVARRTSSVSGRHQLLSHLLGVLASGQVQRLLEVL